MGVQIRGVPPIYPQIALIHVISLTYKVLGNHCSYVMDVPLFNILTEQLEEQSPTQVILTTESIIDSAEQ